MAYVQSVEVIYGNHGGSNVRNLYVKSLLLIHYHWIIHNLP